MQTGWNRLWRWTAWAGILLSLYGGWLTFDDHRDRAASERDIAEACGGLVSGAEVMDLRGGIVRAETGDHDRLGDTDVSGACVVYEVPGPGKSEYWFTLVVEADGTEPLNWVGDDRAEPFGLPPADRDENFDVTAVADRRPEPWPLGDGTLGYHGNWFSNVRAVCGAGSKAQAPPLLYVLARADYEGDVSGEDLGRLTRLARSAARTLADRVGCRTRLPESPGKLTPVPTTLRPARTTGDSCHWFGAYLKEQGQGRLPDRALATPVRDKNPVENCLLAVSAKQVRHIAGTLDGDQRGYADSALTHSPWWIRTVSYFGPEANRVGYDDFTVKDKIISSKSAGQARGSWWASSICDGKPALHTFTPSYLYDDVLEAKTLSSLFRAYVDDITKRRGCTHVTYPKESDFHDS